MPAGDLGDKPAGLHDSGSVALLPEPFEVNAEAVARAAKAARDALLKLSASRTRRPIRGEAAPAAPLDPHPVVPKAG